MNTPFRLAERPRRVHPPLAPPPDRYFEQLPLRMMQRVQAEAPRETAWSWLAGLSAPVRTTLASVAVLGGFVASFLLSSAPAPVASAYATLAQVPREEMVQYLLASDQRLTLSDLAELPAATQNLSTEGYLHASDQEVQDLLDAQPSEETYL
ncbi:hypothetical protein K3G63_01755 [Hymenobacter sp. HSC-4F20]|uniref:hypothetical protein n=1 Tax=Hymenobacter sp. HSC-4F20 TaxID=2864135 RepID=UPI001C734A2E|nr:hypothetical protein [Hymenobacter sp. HSC-4F20]MBX0289141.1 hypothetical protein [Hymenobacter sp. HSC-4F20]